MSRMHMCFVSLLGLVAALCLGGCTWESTTYTSDNWSRNCSPRQWHSTSVVQTHPSCVSDGWGTGYYSQPAPAVSAVPQYITSGVSLSQPPLAECKVDLVVRYLLPTGHLRRIMVLGAGTNVSNTVIDTDLNATNRMFHVSITCPFGTVLNAEAEIYDDAGQDIGWVAIKSPPVINSLHQSYTWIINDTNPVVVVAPPAESAPCRPH